MTEMTKTTKDLPQYHFERDDFVRTFRDVFEAEQIEDVTAACDGNTHTGGFLLYHADDEYYIIHLASGIIVNWYKHLGRTNTCNRPDFTLDDLRGFLAELKSALFNQRP